MKPQYGTELPLGPEGWRQASSVGRISLLVPPATYTVKLAVGGQEFSQKLNVLKDPHSTGTLSDIETQTRLVSALRDQMNTLAYSVNQIESLRAQLANLEKQFGPDDASNAMRKAAGNLADKLMNVEANLIQLKSTGRGQDDVRFVPMLLSKISYLASQVSSSDFPPTTQQVALQEALNQQGDKLQQQFRQVLETDVAAFNSILRERNIPHIITRAP
jgi:formiminotetrahydrofolate cyclodeaminase